MKTFRLLSKVLLLAYIMIGIVSCKKEVFSVTPLSDIVFNTENSSQKIKIKCSGDWYIIVDGAPGGWLVLDKKEGSGDATVTVTVRANPNFESRKCVLRIGNYEDTEICINVTQKGFYKGTLLVGAWKGEKEVCTLYEDGALVDRSENFLYEQVLEFNADGSYMLWEKDGYFWKEQYNDVYYVDDDILVLTEDAGEKDYEMSSMTTLKMTLTYKEDYNDVSTGKHCLKTIVRTYKMDEAWVTPGIFQLKDYSVNLNAGGKYKIVSNGTEVIYKSLNPYVATVDAEGLVVANFVGTAVVEVEASEGKQIFTTYVKPVYAQYKEPYLDFTKTKSEIIAMYNTDYYYNDYYVWYPVGGYFLGYYFEGETLRSSCIFAKGASFEVASGFLGERYHYVGYEGGMHLYADFENIAVGLYGYSTDWELGSGYVMEYIPYRVSNVAGKPRQTLSPEKRFMKQAGELWDLHIWTE